jgi:hypothetical protein
MRTAHWYKGIRMEIVMEEMKGAKIHVFETGSDSKVAFSLRYNFQYPPHLLKRAKEKIDKMLIEHGDIRKAYRKTG